MSETVCPYRFCSSLFPLCSSSAKPDESRRSLRRVVAAVSAAGEAVALGEGGLLLAL